MSRVVAGEVSFADFWGTQRSADQFLGQFLLTEMSGLAVFPSFTLKSLFETEHGYVVAALEWAAKHEDAIEAVIMYQYGDRDVEYSVIEREVADLMSSLKAAVQS